MDGFEGKIMEEDEGSLRDRFARRRKEREKRKGEGRRP